MDELIYFGDEIKSHGNGRFSGHLVRFSSVKDKDMAGDYFTKETEFGIADGQKTPIYFNHRLPLKTRDGQQLTIKAKIGEGTLTLDDEGVLIDAILFNREKYEEAIIAAGKAKKLGWSSGTAKHLVDREDDGFIKTWPLGLDASITPIPCDPKNCASVKSIGDVDFVALEEFAPETEIDIKGIFEEQLAESTPTTWQLQSTFETAMRKLATVAANVSVTNIEVDVSAKVTEGANEYMQRLIPVVISQINDYVESGSSDHFYLKTIFDELKDAPAASRFADHLEVVLAAAGEVQTRAKSIQDLRVKAGRVLSEANRSRLSKLLESLQTCAGDIEGLLKDSEPPAKTADEEILNGLVANYELLKFKRAHAARS